MWCSFRSSDDDRRAIDRLRKEAQRSRPAFSENLHHRLRAAVLPLAARSPVQARRPVWALAAVAGLLVCAAASWYGWSRVERRAAARASMVAAWASLPDSAELGVREMDRLADSLVTFQPWTDLDHDARLAASAVAECFPLQGGRAGDGAKAERLD